MNRKIKALNKKLLSVVSDAADIENQLQAEYNKVFDKNTEIKKAIAEVQNSQEYCWNDFEEICQWSRFYAKDFKDCQEYLKTYLREYHCIDIDFKNDALLYSTGFNIIINDDGDILEQDSGKWIIKKDDYRDDDGHLDENKRNELIEKHMEKTGCFPSVFRCDRYGNVFLEDTRNDKKTA